LKRVFIYLYADKFTFIHTKPFKFQFIKDLMKSVDVAVAIITNVKNEVLLQKKDQGYIWFPGKWCLFGGRIEENESQEQTLLRELKEELGDVFPLRIDQPKYFDTKPYRDVHGNKERIGQQNIYSIQFHGSINDLRIHEGAGFAFFSRFELDTLGVVDHDLKAIKDFYDRV